MSVFLLESNAALPPEPELPACDLVLDSYSYEPRAPLTAALERELAGSGCWLLARRMASATAAELRFELQLGAVVDMYAGLLAAGLELTRTGHADITGLCTLRKYRGRPPGSVVTVRLTVTFLDEISVASVLATGTAFA